MFFRLAELTARPKATTALTAKLSKIEDLMTKWETTMEHITDEERGEVMEKVGEVRKWIEEKVAEQEANDVTADPVFTSDEVPGQTKNIEKLVAKLMKKPKPKPVPVEKNETDAEKSETEATSDEESSSDETPEGSSEESTEEAKEEGSDTSEEDKKEEDAAKEGDEL